LSGVVKILVLLSSWEYRYLTSDFDRPAYSAMIEDVRSGKIGTIIIKDMTRWGRDYLEVGNAMELMRVQQVRFIAINSGIDSAEPSTLEFAPFINIMSEY